jgi:dolichol kinase
VTSHTDAVATAPANGLSYVAELRRKSLHLTALGFPVGIVLVRRPVALAILISLAVFAVALDVLRQKSSAVREPFLRVFGGLMRPQEVPADGAPLVLNGAVWMCVAAAACAVLYPAPVAAAALIMQQMGDAAAAIVGRRYGTIRLPGLDKTLQGSAALAVVAFATAWLFARLPVEGLAESLPASRLAAGAVAAAIAEALPLRVDDNLRVPLIAGAAMLLAP